MIDPHPFKNRIALITGSGRGIGKSIALHFARLGADVVINFFRNRPPAEQTAAEIQALGRKAHLIKANLGEIDQLETLIAETGATFGGLDYLIHNAASGFNRPVTEQRPKGWDWSMNINARSLLFMAQYALPWMQKRGGGAIVSISSPGSQRVLPDYVSVGASKAALEAVTRYLAIELAPHQIVVNAISPGIVATEALQHFAAVRDDQDLLARARTLTPAGRLLTPDDIAGVVAFLCTPAAAMIRGQVLVVDGGYTLPVPGTLEE
ncbi:MAG: enoyl-[acyl-carrier-protein] reductase FabL [Anaerolineales bacterium]|nr:enoyl-[acyl-carrier-protein] reductase FabL [Anaerolineales bacterium]